jgi:ribosomal protein S6--L-glutamate ligase
MKIGILMLRHSPTCTTPIMTEVVRLLREWRAEVEVIHPEEQCTRIARLSPSHDLYVLKSASDLVLSYAGALHAAGAAVLNPYPSVAMLRDRIVATRRLVEEGVPVPESYVTADPKTLAPLLEEGPLVLKPARTSRRGVHVVWDADELDEVSSGEAPVFAQRYHRPDGRERKIYCIGDKLYAVMRTWPARTFDEKVGEAFALTPDLREIALACGRAFGVELFAVDVLVSEGRPFVVNVQSFPGFKGVPEAALRLADYLYTAAQRAIAARLAHPGAPAQAAGAAAPSTGIAPA